MTLPKTPEGWAIHLTKILVTFQAAHGLDRFPVDVVSIAREYSKQVFPDEPITLVKGTRLSSKFDGMLTPNPAQPGEWGIIYNESIRSRGRINFTLAHELGHYLLHREMSAVQTMCSNNDMRNWKSEKGQIEAQANTFASFLLMPLDDFRAQLKLGEITLEFMQTLRKRYDVSLTAVILKWLQITEKRAMIVIAKDGFIDWAWSSDNLLKSGIFYRARQEVTVLPTASLAAKNDLLIDNLTGVQHPAGVWHRREEVREMTIFSERLGQSLSLLIFENRGPIAGTGTVGEWDCFDQFQSNH